MLEQPTSIIGPYHPSPPRSPLPEPYPSVDTARFARFSPALEIQQYQQKTTAPIPSRRPPFSRHYPCLIPTSCRPMTASLHSNQMTSLHHVREAAQSIAYPSFEYTLRPFAPHFYPALLCCYPTSYLTLTNKNSLAYPAHLPTLPYKALTSLHQNSHALPRVYTNRQRIAQK